MVQETEERVRRRRRRRRRKKKRGGEIKCQVEFRWNSFLWFCLVIVCFVWDCSLSRDRRKLLYRNRNSGEMGTSMPIESTHQRQMIGSPPLKERNVSFFFVYPLPRPTPTIQSHSNTLISTNTTLYSYSRWCQFSFASIQAEIVKSIVYDSNFNTSQMRR